MTNPSGDIFSPAALWNIIALAVPIVLTVVVATYKILQVLRKEIRSEMSPIMDRIDKVEQRFIDTVRQIWESQLAQDHQIEAVTAAHNRLEGAHDAFILMEGHGGTGRRKIARGEHCTEKE